MSYDFRLHLVRHITKPCTWRAFGTSPRWTPSSRPCPTSASGPWPHWASASPPTSTPSSRSKQYRLNEFEGLGLKNLGAPLKKIETIYFKCRALFEWPYISLKKSKINDFILKLIVEHAVVLDSGHPYPCHRTSGRRCLLLDALSNPEPILFNWTTFVWRTVTFAETPQTRRFGFSIEESETKRK